MESHMSERLSCDVCCMLEQAHEAQFMRGWKI